MVIELFILVGVLAILSYFAEAFKRKNFPPGPTKFPVIGNIIQIAQCSSPLPAISLHELSKTYGKIMYVKIGFIESIILSDHEIIHELFCRNELQSRPLLDELVDRNFNKNMGIGFSNGRTWEIIRKFSMRALKDNGFGAGQMEKLIHKEIEEFMENQLATINANDGVLRVEALFFPSTTNVIWSFITGRRLSYKDPRLMKFIRLTDEFFTSFNFGGSISTAFPILRRLFPELSGKNHQNKLITETHAFIRDLIQLSKNRVGRKLSPSNFIEIFLNQCDEEETNPDSVFNDEQLIVVLMDFLQGGSETPANLLSFAILYFTCYPTVQENVRKEIEKVLQGRIPTLEDKSKMVYTEAAIFEVTRCANVTPLAIPRKVTNDFYYNGFLFKQGMQVISNLHTVYNDPTLFPDPEIFRPERFILSDGTLDTHKFKIMAPFGHGRRLCVGSALAMNTIFLFVTSLLQKMTFKCVPGQPCPTLAPKLGVSMSPQPFDVVVELKD